MEQGITMTKDNHIILHTYPSHRNSLILVPLDRLCLPESVDWSSIKVSNDEGCPLLFDLVEYAGSANELMYELTPGSNTLVIVNNLGVQDIVISYNISRNPQRFVDCKGYALRYVDNAEGALISTEKVNIQFSKSGYIKGFKIGSTSFGSLQMMASGGRITTQSGGKLQFKDIQFQVVATSNLLTAVVVRGKLKVDGENSKQPGWLPVVLTYTFWTSDSANIFARIEIDLEYENSIGLDENHVPFLNPLLWYVLMDDRMPTHINDYFVNRMCSGSTIVTLKRPYYAYVTNGSSSFVMSPYLTLPCDGTHIEVNEKDSWWGAAFHSLSEPDSSPYWHTALHETHPKSQGYFPAQSLHSYWKIGLAFLVREDPVEAARMFTYPSKTRYAEHDNRDKVGNAYITHWRNNASIAVNAITDDLCKMDYIARVVGLLPKSVQISLPGNLKRRWQRDLIEKKSFLRFFFRRFLKNPFLFIPHTYNHRVTWQCTSDEMEQEIVQCENNWLRKWNFPIPLSCVLPFTSPHGIATPEGTREAIVFSSSKSTEWIREWYYPHAPTDFFLPTPLYWGLTLGVDFVDEPVKTQKGFETLYDAGADYFQMSGHLEFRQRIAHASSVLKMVGPVLKYMANLWKTYRLFRFLEDKEDVWLAAADEIIMYYKAKNQLSVGRVSRKGKYYIINIDHREEPIYDVLITLVQMVKTEIKSYVYTTDYITWYNIKYHPLSSSAGSIIFSVPSNTTQMRLELKETG
ncbi:MAG: hypothetical protein ACUZ8I_11725 [Candidatus Scalindua sp.]